jgi:hypothetical protein
MLTVVGWLIFYNLKLFRLLIMDDIDRDINNAQIGKRKETAHEQINHPKIPQTNLPPMKAKGALLTPNAIRVKGGNIQQHNTKSSNGFWLWLLVLLVAAIIATKIIGIW